MQTVDIFASYNTSSIPDQSTMNFDLPISRKGIIPSLIHLMGVHYYPPTISFLFGASLVDALVGHPYAPPLPSHPSTVYALVCHPCPPPLPSMPSIKDAIVYVASDKVVKLSAPPASDSPSMPKIFMVR